MLSSITSSLAWGLLCSMDCDPFYPFGNIAAGLFMEVGVHWAFERNHCQIYLKRYSDSKCKSDGYSGSLHVYYSYFFDHLRDSWGSSKGDHCLYGLIPQPHQVTWCASSSWLGYWACYVSHSHVLFVSSLPLLYCLRLYLHFDCSRRRYSNFQMIHCMHSDLRHPHWYVSWQDDREHSQI